MSKTEILTQLRAIVVGVIKSKTPPLFETLRQVHEKLGEIVVAAKAQGETTDVAYPFVGGIQEIIARLRTYETSIAENMENTQTWKGISPDTFLAGAADQVQKALEDKDDVQALRRLYNLKGIIEKAFNFEAGSGDVNVPVSNDPWAYKWTEQPGTLAATGTVSPSTAPANFAANPNDVGSAAAPTTNGGTGAVEGLAGGVSAPSAAPANFTVNPNDIFKRLEKSADDARGGGRVYWPGDLNRASFLKGTGPKEDFGADPWATK